MPPPPVISLFAGWHMAPLQLSQLYRLSHCLKLCVFLLCILLSFACSHSVEVPLDCKLRSVFLPWCFEHLCSLWLFLFEQQRLTVKVRILLPKWIIQEDDSMPQRIPFKSSGTKFQIFPALLRYKFVRCDRKCDGRSLSLSFTLSLGKCLVSQDL